MMSGNKKKSREQKFENIMEARINKFRSDNYGVKKERIIENPEDHQLLTKADITLQQAMETFEKNENADLYLQHLLKNNFQGGKNFRWSLRTGKGEEIEVAVAKEETSEFSFSEPEATGEIEKFEDNRKNQEEESKETFQEEIYEDALFSDQLMVLYLRLRHENKILRRAKYGSLIRDYENLNMESEHLKLLADNFALLGQYAEEEIKIKSLALHRDILKALKRQEKLAEEMKQKYPWIEEQLHLSKTPDENQMALFDVIKDEEEATDTKTSLEAKETFSDSFENHEEAREEDKASEDKAIGRIAKKEINPNHLTIDRRLSLRRQQKDPVPGRPMVNNVPLLMVDHSDYTDWHHYLYPQTEQESQSPGSSHVLVKALAGGNDSDASAYLIEIVENKKRILVDAGLRLSTSGERCPDFSSLPRPDLILITRAGYRQAAALPFLAKLWPGVPVWTSPETALLLPALLAALTDQEKIGEQEFPLYTLEEVKKVVYRPIPWQEAHFPFRDDLSITLYPAGNLPGAASFALKSEKESIFISGDFALHKEKTSGGAIWPAEDFDVVLLSISLGRYHKFNRFEMEEIMLEKIEEVLLRGGIALFPVSEMGREISILAMLKQGLSEGLISKVPFYADGRIPQWLQLLEVVNPGELTEEPALDSAHSLRWSYLPVNDHNRGRITNEAACLIVNNAMLKEEAPGFVYFKEILADPASAIFFPALPDGFNDLHRELENHWRRIPGRKAEMLHYRWPGYASGDEILKALELLNPRVALFVHGEPDAHRELRTLVPGNIVRRSLANNETIRIRPQGNDN